MNGKQLKNSILQWAIQGRLVPQDPTDEPAAVLLRRIQAEKAKLVKEGKLKKSALGDSRIFRGEDNKYYEQNGKNITCIDEEIPFEIPETWEWVRLGSVVSVQGGKRMPAGRKLTSENTGHYYIRVSDMKDGNVSTDDLHFVPEDIYPSISKYIIKKEDVYITVAGTIGRVGKIPPKLDGANLTENADRLSFTHINQDWLISALQSFFVQEQIIFMTTKVGQPKLAIERIGKLLLPLPPLAEQRRIVAKVEELLSVVERYEKAQDALDALCNSLDGRLRKSILSEAIRGRLVPQDPTDEPASVLLQRIQAEKAKLVKEGKLKKSALSDSRIFRSEDNKYYEQTGKTITCIDEDIPFEIPETWEWVRIDTYVKNVTDYVASGSFASLRNNVRYYKSPNYAILVKTQDFQNNFVKDLTYIDEHAYNFLANSNLFGGELILSNVGSIGRVFIVPKLNKRMSLAPNAIMVKTFSDEHIKWLFHLFSSDHGLQLLFSISSATAIRKFNKTTFKNLLIPLPPLAEQRRIVSKVEELFAVLDRLSCK